MYKIGDIVPTPYGGKIEIIAIEDDFYIGKEGYAWQPFTAEDGGQYLTAYKGNSPAVDKYLKTGNQPNGNGQPKSGGDAPKAPPVARYSLGDKVNVIIKGQLYTLEPATIVEIIAPVLGQWGYRVELADGSEMIYPEINLEAAAVDASHANGNGPAAAGAASSFTPLSIRDLIAKQFKPQQFLIEGLLAKGNLAILGGRPKSGKTFLGIQAARCIDEGLPFLGRETLKSRVLYYALEDGARRMRERAMLIKWQPQEAAIMLKIANLDDGQGGPGPGVDEIFQQVTDGGFDLVIIDTLIAAMSGRTDERDNSSMGAIINALAQVAHDTERAILILHHTGKALNPDDIFSTLRGASAIRGAYDVGLILERKPGEREAILHAESRDYDIRNMTLRQAENGAGWEFVGDAYEIERIRAGRKVLETMLEHDTDDEGMTAKQLADIRKVSEATVHNQLKRLEESGYVCRDEQLSTQMGRRPDIWHVTLDYRLNKR